MSFHVISLILIAVGISGLFISLSSFWIGFHNVDLVHNLKYLDGLKDIGSDFVARTPLEMYNLGMNQLKDSIVSVFISATLLGLGLGMNLMHIDKRWIE